MRIGLLASSNLLPGSDNRRVDMFEFDEELGSLRPAFAELGLTIDPLLWDDAADYAAEFDAFLPLMVWDYFEGNEARFLDTMREANTTAPVFNPPSLLHWNSDKGYLQDMAANGAKVIPTLSVETVTEASTNAAFEQFAADRIVIKPTSRRRGMAASAAQQRQFVARRRAAPARSGTDPALPAQRDRGR